MKLMQLRRLFTAILCVAMSCMFFIIYLNGITVPKEDEGLEQLNSKAEISAFISNKNAIHGVIRRKVHRDQSAAYAALAGEEGDWSAEDREASPARDPDIRGPIARYNFDGRPSTVPRRHLLPSAYLTTSPGPSDRSSSLSTANSPMYIHHAKASSNEALATKTKPRSKSVPLSHREEKHGKRSIWPSPEDRWDDRIVQQLSYTPQRTAEGINEERLKTILVYSSLGDTPPGREKFLRDKCPIDKCTLSTDVRWIAEADAIVFPYDPGVEVRSWPRRPPHQIWVLSLLESPLNLPSISGLSNQINWTATYRLDSTIVTPYEKFVPYGDKALPDTSTVSISPGLNGKTKQVVWFVSNCVSGNRRMEYARELSNYIQVDIYGDCGKLKCSKQEPSQCQNMLRTDYKFFLAFENSNCQYYITEKFFNALRNDVIPIVMGARKEDYLAVAPPHSFIHTEDFASPKELAQYLHLLGRNQTLYAEYFKWKNSGHFIDTKFWCRLCSILHSPDKPTKWYPNIDKWWRGNDTCTTDKWSKTQDYITDWRRFG